MLALVKFYLDKMIRKLFECFNEDLPKLALFPLTVQARVKAGLCIAVITTLAALLIVFYPPYSLQSITDMSLVLQQLNVS